MRRVERWWAFPYVTSALIGLGLWLLLVDGLLYFLTEYWYVWHQVSQTVRVVGLLMTLMLVALIPEKRMKLFVGLGALGFFTIAMTFHWQFSQYYARLQERPKIKSISKGWTIQDSELIIIGKNFGDILNPGTVRVGDLEYVITDWSNHMVKVKQPMPKGFYTASLELCKTNGWCDLYGLVEIRDPNAL